MLNPLFFNTKATMSQDIKPSVFQRISRNSPLRRMGEAVALYRETNKISLADFIKLIKVSEKTLEGIERGDEQAGIGDWLKVFEALNIEHEIVKLVTDVAIRPSADIDCGYSDEQLRKIFNEDASK